MYGKPILYFSALSLTDTHIQFGHGNMHVNVASVTLMTFISRIVINLLGNNSAVL